VLPLLKTQEKRVSKDKKLYEEHGNEFDLIAYRGLSGQITMSEAKKLAQIEGRKKGGDIARANRNATGNHIGKWSKETGHVYTIATPESMRKGGSKVGRMLVETGKWKEIQSLGGKVGGKIASKITNSQRWQCLECGKIDRPASLGWHMKKQQHVGKVKLDANN
jgi:hypothetical protein